MKVKKVEILQAMKKCLPGVETGKTIIEGADTFVLKKDVIHSYNDSISVSVPTKFDFEEGQEVTVKSIDIFKLISKMPGDEIEITLVEQGLKIKSGKVDAEIKKVQSSISEYVTGLNLQEVTWKDLPKDFFEAALLCKISGNNTPQRGLFVLDKTMISTDITRINRHILSAAVDSFWIDDPSLNELLKLQNIIHYSVTPTWVHFRNKEGVIFSSRKKDEESFPFEKLENIIEDHKKNEEDKETTLPKELAEAVDRVSTLSSEMDGLPAIRMTINKEEIELFAERISGKVLEKVKFEKPFEIESPVSLWVDPFFLIEATKKVSGFYMRTFKKDEEQTINTLVFYSEKYIQIVTTFSE